MSWEDLANDDIPKSEEAPKFTDTTDDIQDDAWNEEEPVVEEKKKEEPKKKKKDKKKKAEKKQEPKKVEPPKPKTEPKGMYKEYQKTSEEFKQVSDLFDKSEQVQRIELLKPQTEKDFEDFADILANKILESKNEDPYLKFIKNLTSKIVAPLKSDQITELIKTLSILQNKKIQEERDLKRPKKSKKPTLRVDRSHDDLFGAVSGETYDDGADDFM